MDGVHIVIYSGLIRSAGIQPTSVAWAYLCHAWCAGCLTAVVSVCVLVQTLVRVQLLAEMAPIAPVVMAAQSLSPSGT